MMLNQDEPTKHTTCDKKRSSSEEPEEEILKRRILHMRLGRTSKRNFERRDLERTPARPAPPGWEKFLLQSWRRRRSSCPRRGTRRKLSSHWRFSRLSSTRRLPSATLYTGIHQAVLAILRIYMSRLGIIVDVLSHSTIVGFIGGTETIISLQQLKGMFGLTHFTTKTDVISVSHAVLKNETRLLVELGNRQYHEWNCDYDMLATVELHLWSDSLLH